MTGKTLQVESPHSRSHRLL